MLDEVKFHLRDHQIILDDDNGSWYGPANTGGWVVPTCGDWRCSNCLCFNFSNQVYCRRCGGFATGTDMPPRPASP